MPFFFGQFSRLGGSFADGFEGWIGHSLGDVFNDLDLMWIRDRDTLLIEGFFDLFDEVKLDVPIIGRIHPVPSRDIYRAVAEI